MASVGKESSKGLSHGAITAALIFSIAGGAFLTAAGLQAPGHPWLSYLTLLPLFAAIRVVRPLEGLFYGALWGVCLCGFSTFVFGADFARQFSSIFVLTAVPGLYAFLATWLTRRIGFSPFVLGVGWMAVEVVFGSLGLNHGLLAATQGDSTLMHWVGGALGYILVAFVVGWVNAIVVSRLASVCAVIAQARYVVAVAVAAARRVSEIFSFSPVFLLSNSRPRAPPTCRISLLSAKARSRKQFRVPAHDPV